MKPLSIKLRHCPQAEEEHANSIRQYLHTNHYHGTICYAEDFWKLPWHHILGLLAHELGHIFMILDGKEDHYEPDADWAAKTLLGVTIKYATDSPYGEDLQFISPRDGEKMLEKVMLDKKGVVVVL